MHLRSISLIAALVACNATLASAQVDSTGQTTKKELAELHVLGEKYIEDFGVKIDWQKVSVFRFDLDGDGTKEAILRFEISDLCGASTCQMVVVKWIAGKATLISALADSQLVPLKERTNGWHDMWAHYYTYKWNGESYKPACLEDNACDPDSRAERDRKAKP